MIQKYYIPTTTLNLNNILSSESISPKAFYAARGFGYSSWESIPENDVDNAIILYGQPLEKIKIASIPNGLLLAENPNYIKQYPHLFFPGKDDKSKDLRKIRARVSFDILKKIDSWRVKEILI